MKERLIWIDIAKGITILLVIIGHTIKTDTFLWRFIFSFHMPIFFIISGYLFKENTLKKLIKKNLKRMFVPYLGTSLIIVFIAVFAKMFLHHTFYSMPEDLSSLCISIIYGCGVNYPKFFTPIWMIGAIWFLLCLFFAEIFFAITIQLTSKLNIYIQATIIVFLSFVGFFIGQYIFLPWNIDISLVALVFLYAGYMFKKKNIINLRVNTLVLILLIILWATSVQLGAMDMAGRKYSNFIICIIGAISASYIIIKFCKLISKYMLIDKYLSTLGKETLVILCFHLLEMDFFPWQTSTKFLAYANNIMLLIILKVIFAIIIIISVKKIPLLRKVYYYEKYIL